MLGLTSTARWRWPARPARTPPARSSTSAWASNRSSTASTRCSARCSRVWTLSTPSRRATASSRSSSSSGPRHRRLFRSSDVPLDHKARLERRALCYSVTPAAPPFASHRGIMKQSDVRNIAIIAHVDHGKTTLVDRLLQTTHVFRDNQPVAERVLDSNDQERERGITILAKNISIRHKGVKINVIDTPGHADFGGEVERVLKMADGALLIVDAFEGPMPQTRFVLKKALEHGLKPVVVINKIDRDGSRPHEVVDQVFDLMVELGANDDQLDFPIVYTSAVDGYARKEFDDGNMDMIPLLETIVAKVPVPDVDINGPVAMQVCTIDYSSFVGRIGIGRVFSGTIHAGEKILVVKNDGSKYLAQVKQLFTFEGMGRLEAESAHAGDICAVVG